MNVILAEKSGFCFGVKRAVNEALEAKEKFGKKIYTLGPLIHNPDVVNYLKENGIIPIEFKDIDNLSPESVIIIRSHGIPLDLKNDLQKRGLVVVDATCPFVSNIQHIVNKYYSLGYKIVIVGDKFHPEVVGINGWCNNEAIVTRDGSEIKNINDKVCVVAQTTEKQANWEKVLGIVVKYCKEFVGFNTICKATEERQSNAMELSKAVDLMVVIGGKNSSNTAKLFEICSENCKNTIYVENANEISNEILNKNIKTIGVTAGASTPDWIIKEAIKKMEENKIDFNEQLEFMEKNTAQIAVGQKISGEIISVNEKEAFLNIGYKAEGILPKNEVTADEDENLTDLLKVGDILDVKVIKRRNDDGYVVLSKLEMEKEKAFNEIKDAFENKNTINIKIKDASNSGLVGSYKGIRVFLPASHVELHHTANLDQYKNKELQVNIIEFDDSKNKTKIIASRRDLLKSEKKKAEEAIWNRLEKGIVVEGEVKRLADFGAFVEIEGNVEGLLHVSEMSWGRIDKPSDILKVGDIIKVYILEADKEHKKLSLSMKKLIENPWNNIDEKYLPGNTVIGKVVRFANFGAFVELEPGVDGLVHISQISNKRIAKPSDVLEIGEIVKAKILDVDKEKKKIGLSIKDVD